MDDSTPRLSLLVAVAWVLAGGVAAQLAGAMCASTLSTLLVASGELAAGQRSAPAVILPAMAVSSLTLLAAAAAAPLVAGLPLRVTLGLRRADVRVFAAAAVGTVMLNPLADVLMRAMELLFPQATLGVMQLLQDIASSAPWFVVFPVFAVLPGLSEELMFRGVLQRAAGHGPLAIFLSGTAFALFHADPHHIAGVLPLGFFLAWCASRAGTLVSMVAHVANNAMAVIAVHSDTLSVGYGSDRAMPWQWLPIGLAVTFGCGVVIARLTRRNEPLNRPPVPCSSSPHVEDRPHR